MEEQRFEIADAVQIAAVSAATRWSQGDPTADSLVDVDDLVQEIWGWYYERPSVQARIAEAEFKTAAVKTFSMAAYQILSDAALANDRFMGKDLYRQGSVKDELMGVGQNKYLKHIMPFALQCLEAKQPDYREALRSRYEDEKIPAQGSPAVTLTRAIDALTREVNGLYLAGEKADQRKPDGDTRRASGGHSDPTADMALSLMASGEADILIYNREGEIVDHTTLRDEFLRDDFQMGPTGRSGTDQDTLFDGMFMDIERGAMYRAQVFPELYPEEGRMLTENWPQEDLEAYCGGEHTVGYRHLSVVR